ncbi:hypothetical protein C5C45_07265 [Rathayibacter rathayi]|nr:hypothetical protein C5C02_08740 [Rathayibacter rathayi]PPG75954.1 hypothetical protein C5C23_08765 [Rathayibacter rathayi]PPH68433.1 hypothetical protein C5C45_07265 [Rathayibacter rathayi]PPI76407.1 hypothetical protein C5E03_09680 [Rathayibacter rathayi]
MRAIDGRIRYQRKCEIDVVQFVPSEQVDPIMFDRAYILEPDSSSPKAYVLLRRTLEQTDRTAIVEFALRQKTRLAALRVRGTLLMLQTLLWANEVREVEFSSLEEGSGGEVLDLMEALRRSVERSRGPKGAGAGAGAAAAESAPKKADPEKADPEKASASSPTKAAAKKPPTATLRKAPAKKKAAGKADTAEKGAAPAKKRPTKKPATAEKAAS